MEGALISGLVSGVTSAHLCTSKNKNICDAVFGLMVMPWVFIFSSVPIFVIGFGIKVIGLEIFRNNLAYDIVFGIFGGFAMNKILGFK